MHRWLEIVHAGSFYFLKGDKSHKTAVGIPSSISPISPQRRPQSRSPNRASVCSLKKIKLCLSCLYRSSPAPSGGSRSRADPKILNFVRCWGEFYLMFLFSVLGASDRVSWQVPVLQRPEGPSLSRRSHRSFN